MQNHDYSWNKCENGDFRHHWLQTRQISEHQWVESQGLFWNYPFSSKTEPYQCIFTLDHHKQKKKTGGVQARLPQFFEQKRSLSSVKTWKLPRPE